MKYFFIIVVIAVVGYFVYKKIQDSQKVDTSFTGRAFMDPEEYEKQEAERKLQEEAAAKEAAEKAAAKEAAKSEAKAAVKAAVSKPVFKKPAVAEPSTARTIEEDTESKAFKVSEEVKILIADDNRKDVNELSRLAEAVGIQVSVADNGIYCIDMAKKDAYDLIFIARDMSRMDGVQTLRNMKKREEMLSENAPVFAVVSRDSDEPAIFFEKEGFSGVIRKPVGEYVFCQLLSEHLPKEKVLADDSLLKEINLMAEHEKKLQASGVQLSAALKNYGGNVKEFRKDLAEFCESYEDESSSIMDSLYAGNAAEYMDKVRQQRNMAEQLGALHLADIFDDHVNMAKNDDMEIAEASWRTLELEWEHVVSGVSKWLGKKDTISSATVILTAE